MNIQWKYLDKRSATIAAIKDYDSMSFILRDTERQIEKANSRLSVGGMKLDAMPSVHDPKSGEKQLLAAVDEINILEQRYQEAQEYMAWFEPAWKQIDEQDRYILKTFYQDNCYGAVYVIGDKLGMEAPTVYKAKNRALLRLQVLLYGRS